MKKKEGCGKRYGQNCRPGQINNKGLLIRSLEFNLSAVTFRGEHYGILICSLEELVQLQCEG